MTWVVLSTRGLWTRTLGKVSWELEVTAHTCDTWLVHLAWYLHGVVVYEYPAAGEDGFPSGLPRESLVVSGDSGNSGKFGEIWGNTGKYGEMKNLYPNTPHQALLLIFKRGHVLHALLIFKRGHVLHAVVTRPCS